MSREVRALHPAYNRQTGVASKLTKKRARPAHDGTAAELAKACAQDEIRVGGRVGETVVRAWTSKQTAVTAGLGTLGGDAEQIKALQVAADGQTGAVVERRDVARVSGQTVSCGRPATTVPAKKSSLVGLAISKTVAVGRGLRATLDQR